MARGTLCCCLLFSYNAVLSYGVECNSNLIFCFPNENINGHNDDVMYRSTLCGSTMYVAFNENHTSNQSMCWDTLTGKNS